MNIDNKAKRRLEDRPGYRFLTDKQRRALVDLVGEDSQDAELEDMKLLIGILTTAVYHPEFEEDAIDMLYGIGVSKEHLDIAMDVTKGVVGLTQELLRSPLN
jgi:hypothetical protein